MNRVVETLIRVFCAVLVLVLAVATLVEDRQGTLFVEKYIYGNWWFVFLCMVAFLLTAFHLVQVKVWKNVLPLLFSVSLALISIGAFLTYLTAERGYAHLQKERKCITFEGKDRKVHQLPFEMVLDSFCVRYYPGTEAPMDYVSYMRVDGTPEVVSMNKNFVKDGYRFCQSSFDEEGAGSWLSVNHDPYGVTTMFAGYLLFALAGLASLFWRGSRFRQLLQDPLLKKGGVLLLVLFFSFPCSYGAETAVPVISKEKALELQRNQVVYQNRIVPFNTVAIDFVKKITGTANYHGLMPEQVVGGWSIAPEMWHREKMIKVKSAELRQALGMTGDYCSMADLYDDKGRYRLQALWMQEQQSHEVSKLEKAIGELDEKVGIIQMLLNNTLMKPLPQDRSVQPLSDAKVSAELLYNRLPLTKILFMLNLTLGFLSCALLFYRGLSRSGQSKSWVDNAFRVLPFLLFLILLVQGFGYGLRWYVSGRLPLNNGYETMQFFSLVVLLMAALSHRRYSFVLPFGLLLSGFTLLVSHLGEMNPQITPLMPVLNSPWLSAHVSMIMMSYALFAFIMLNSLFALVLMSKADNQSQVEQLTLINQILLYPASILIGVGIALGSVWANESWGNYWGWDPKEVWALITFMVYGAPIIFSQASLFTKHKLFHLYLLLAFLTVLMTYFGVNYILGGMHSYANS
ncbi:MAG: cytochrome c biogenesis protein CcsA [Paludibacteraceae bacterium]|nr:cytochrome c biogenesis protein CcsA [Paludibacteraceae bacterium]